MADSQNTPLNLTRYKRRPRRPAPKEASPCERCGTALALCLDWKCHGAIACCPDCKHPVPPKCAVENTVEIEASARLIAAAPELLAMVHCLREHVYTAGSGYLTKMVAEADALIARILQETQ